MAPGRLSGKEIDDGLKLVGVTVVIVDGELQKFGKSIGELLRGGGADFIGVEVEGPRYINTAVVVVAGFLPAGAVGGVVSSSLNCAPLGGFAGKGNAVC